MCTSQVFSVVFFITSLFHNSSVREFSLVRRMCHNARILQCAIIVIFMCQAQANAETEPDYEYHLKMQIPVGCNNTFCVRLCKELEFNNTFDEERNETMTTFDTVVKKALWGTFDISLDNDVGFEYGNQCPFLRKTKQLEATTENLEWANGQLIIKSHNVSLNQDEFCIDIQLDGDTVAVSVEACLEIVQISISKCCSTGRAMDRNGSCVPSNVLGTSLPIPYLDVQTDSYQLLDPIHVNATDGATLACEGEVVSLNGTVSKTGSTMFVITATSSGETTLHLMQSVLFKQEFGYHEYCMDKVESESHVASSIEDEHTVMVQVCDPCRQRRCVKRCCAGKFYVNASTGFCEAYNFILPPMSLSFEDDQRVSYISTDYLEFPYAMGSVRGEIIDSAWDITLTQDRNDFYIQKGSGYLRAPNHLSKDALIREYCIDYFVKDAAHFTVKAYFRDPPLNEFEILTLRIYHWFLFISCGFLEATFLVYASLKKLRNLQGIIMMSLVASMGLSYFCLGYIQYQGAFLNNASCVAIASFAHYFFVAAFTWMTILSTDLLSKFRSVQLSTANRELGMHRKALFYSAIGWGLPLMFEILTQILRWYPEDDLPLWLIKPRFGQLRCWFSGHTEITAYFYTPLGILIGINTVSFIWAAIAYYRTTVSSQVCAIPGGQKQIRKRLFTSLRVFVLMGVSWVAEVVSFAIGSTTWSMATDVWNMIQGILIFWMFVCKKDVLRMVEEKLQNLKKSVQDRFNLPFGSTSAATKSTESSSELKIVPPLVGIYHTKK